MSFYAFTSTALANAEQVVDNFLHIYQGNRLPLSATASGTLTASDGNLDLGSDTYRWKNLYCNNIVVASSTVTAPYMWSLKSQVILSSTAASIELTGLNGDSVEEFKIETTSYGISASSEMIFNGDSSSSYYVIFTSFESGLVTPVANTAASIEMGTPATSHARGVLSTKTGKPRIVKFSRYRPITGWASTGHASWSNTSSTLTTIKFYPDPGIGGYFQPGYTVKLWSRN